MHSSPIGPENSGRRRRRPYESLHQLRPFRFQNEYRFVELTRQDESSTRISEQLLGQFPAVMLRRRPLALAYRFATILSLLALAASVLMWIRSELIQDELDWMHQWPDSNGYRARALELYSARGEITGVWTFRDHSGMPAARFKAVRLIETLRREISFCARRLCDGRMEPDPALPEPLQL